MAKLYPPNIEGSIPAFYGTVLTVPFSMNRSVGRQEVSGIALKVKTIQSNSFLFETSGGIVQWGGTNPTVTFDLAQYIGKLNAGQFYKIQIAYIDKSNVVGYYSTVGVVKYTDRPSITIDGLDTLKINNFNHSFVGTYTPGDNDPTEKEYSYRFVITDSANNIVEDSGTCIHRSDNDTTANQSSDRWDCLNDLNNSGIHYIQYIVNTVNNIQLKTYKYKILARNNASMDIPITLTATLDFDNGYVSVVAQNNPPTATLPLTGGFVLTRLDTSNPTAWVEIQRQNLQSVLPSDINFKDFTIEQGKTYIYGLQQYNDNGLYSERIVSNSVYADFEHAFLFDGTRQLKIEYNPKVTSFKIDVLESKIDTIGSKYPFIFRNGSVFYKEFPISGLISYWSDDEELFMTKSEMRLITNTDHRTQTNADDFNYVDTARSHEEINAWGETEVATHIPNKDLINYNVAAERWFKLTVLDWLNNGKPKLFRSPAEGNYIVRLLNTSLSPNDTVGRMLHTFTSQAYEVEEYSYDKLKEYGLTQKQDFIETIPKWSTVQMSDFADNTSGYKAASENWLSKLKNSASGCNEVNLNDFIPGTIIEIKLASNPLPTQITIGATGNYHFVTDDIITSISYPDQITTTVNGQTVIIDNVEKWRNRDATMVFTYEEPIENIFALIEDSIVDEAQVRQVYGQYVDVEYEGDIAYYRYFNLFWALQDYLPSASRADTDLFKTSIWRLLELRFNKREMEPLYFKVSDYLADKTEQQIDDSWEGDGGDLSQIDNFITTNSQGEGQSQYKYPLLNEDMFDYLYIDRDLQTPAKNNLNPAILYKIVLMHQPSQMNQQLYFEEDERLHKITDVYIDGQTTEVCLEEDYSTKVYIDIGAADHGRNAYAYSEWDAMVEHYKDADSATMTEDNVQILDLEDTDEIIIKQAFPEHDFFTGIGVTTTAVFMLKTVVYNIENTEGTRSYDAKQNYETKRDQYAANIAASGESLSPSEDEVLAAYDAFVTVLDEELTEWLQDNGRL